MKLVELVKKYKGTAKFDVDIISDGESKDAIVFTNAECDAVKDEIVNADVVRFCVTSFVNNSPTLNVAVKLEEKQPEDSGTDSPGGSEPEDDSGET